MLAVEASVTAAGMPLSVLFISSALRCVETVIFIDSYSRCRSNVC